MKILVLFLMFFGVLAAGAQEMDTTYVVNEQGQTIGLIHEKGVVPVLRESPAPETEAAALETKKTVSKNKTSSRMEIDSVAYYQKLVDRYTQSGLRKRSVGQSMLIGGAIGLGVGLLLMVTAEDDNCDYGCSSDDDFDDGLQFLSGYVLALGGGVMIGVGATLKIVGGAKLRKAERYNNALKRYVERKQALSLRVAPIFNPVTGALGSRVALEF